MSIKPLTCDTIGGLDNGLFGRLVDEEIRRIVDDLEDRGHDGNKRTLTIEIAFEKDVSRDPHAPAIHIDPQVRSKLPAKRSGVTSSKVSTVAGGQLQLIFRDDNSDNPDQPTIYDDERAARGE